jgi:ATP-binding cassette subfamily B protein/subfamily B ATP-binding cassette protein MsbA
VRRLRSLLRRQLGPYLAPLLDQRPAARLIRASARRHWRLLTVNLFTTLAAGLGEGATLGVIFLAVGLMTAPSSQQWARLPLLQSLPWLQHQLDLLAAWPRPLLFCLLLGLAVLFQTLMALMGYINSVSANYFAARVNTEITGLLHSRILSFTYACASRYRVGDLLDYARSGGSTVQTQINLANGLFMNSIQLLVYLAVLVALSPWLLLVALAMGSVLTLVQRRLLPRLSQISGVIQGINVTVGSRITEDIQGLRLLHSSGQLQPASQALGQNLANYRTALYRSSRIGNVIGPLGALLPILAIAIIAGVSVLTFSGRSSGVLPSLVTFVLALQRLNVRLGGLAGIATSYANNSAQVARLNEILGDQFVRSGGRPFQQIGQQVQLDAVVLRYSPDLPPALRGVDLTIPRGRTVALVGESGAGKSSIADLLVGLYEPSEGRILIDGHDLQEINLASWQQRLGVVSQDTFLFNASIAANIAYGCPEASRERIEAAAATAQALGFIRQLPDGFDTLIGERGYRLSGGQRQRLSLARAVLREPELLILDEATSALDSESERLVQQALEQFERHHTVLVIAHRLSTIVNADLICVLQQGRIVERGSHAELLALNGGYARLWRQQSQAAGQGGR